MTSRRDFLWLGAALGAGALARPAAAQSRVTINVKDAGASGTGQRSDLPQLRRALETAARHSGPVTVLFPRGEYSLGVADDAYLLVASRLRNVRFVGEGATISCRSLHGQNSMLVLAGCQDVSVEGITFRDYGLKREINWLGAAAVRLVNDGAAGCENIEVKNCNFESVLSAIVCRVFDARARNRGLTLTNLSVSQSYYGFSFQDSCDDVVGRALRCNDVKRSYFPYGVSNHDIELDTANNSTGFTDVLIKTYEKDTVGLRVKVRCRGKRSGDAIVALDHQHERGHGTMRNINLDLDIDDADCKLDRAILIRSFDPQARVEKQTNNRWDDIVIDGDVRICNKTKLLDIASVGRVTGRLQIGPRLARHPGLPAQFPGFSATVLRS